MRLIRLYVNCPLAANSELELPPEASHYIGKVLRAKPGQALSLFNGDGQEYAAEVTEVGKKVVNALVGASQTGQPASPLHTHLGQVMSRGDRMDYAVQKATEMGVTEITPLFSERCEVKLDPKRLEKRLAHWHQIAISACEQSGRCDVPTIHEPQQLDSWLNSVEADCKLTLHPHNTVALQDIPTPTSCALLIGPEGGLTEDEVESARQQDFVAICLGPRILRTETAPVASLALLQHLWGDY